MKTKAGLVIPEAPVRVLPRLTLLIWGPPKSGKTHLALTAPGPICYFDLDQGAEDLLLKFPGKVRAEDYHRFWIPTVVRDQQDTLDRICRQYVEDIKRLAQEGGGTIVWDTASQLWQMICSIKMEEVKQRRAKKQGKDEQDVEFYPFDYAQSNSLMEGICRQPLEHGNIQVIWICRTSEEYEGKEKTGRDKMQGYKGLVSMAKLVVELRAKRGQQYADRIIQFCRSDMTNNGLNLGEGVDFDQLREIYGDGLRDGTT